MLCRKPCCVRVCGFFCYFTNVIMTFQKMDVSANVTALSLAGQGFAVFRDIFFAVTFKKIYLYNKHIHREGL